MTEPPAGPLASLAQLALARRITSDHGTDAATALAMVTDVAERGADSPHAQVVSDAASAILAPFTAAVGQFAVGFARAMTSFAGEVEKALRPWVDALAKIEADH